MYFVYMIKNNQNDLYVGITDNPNRRLAEHNGGIGANFTKSHYLFSIVFLEEHENSSSARKREIQIKKWRRDKKEMLIEFYKKGIQTIK